MIIALSAHDRIVASLESRVAELERDRDYYRAIVLGSEIPPAPLAPRKNQRAASVASAIAQQQAEEDFDSAWSDDDHALFNQWATDQPESRQGVNMRKLWMAKYGSQSPLMALSL